MKGFENLNKEIAKDLIEFVNSITGFEKSKSVNYETKNGTIKFNYVPLDDILTKVKENDNFALMQPIGTDENGRVGVKCVLIHKSGHVLESDIYPFRLAENSKLQDEGTEITYKKRYALVSFLGMATEEDDDCANLQMDNSTERKATQKQINAIKKYCKKDILTGFLESNNIENIEDLSFTKANELIKISLAKEQTND